jgi:hypothetical protein
MKPDAVLINTARGGIVDELALAQALRSGHLDGAAIDVFETEPLPVAAHWQGCPGLILTPHIAGVTTAIRTLRKASRNPDVGVMVGGPIFLLHPDLVTVVGADFTAVDAREAVESAAAFAGRRIGRC